MAKDKVTKHSVKIILEITKQNGAKFHKSELVYDNMSLKSVVAVEQVMIGAVNALGKLGLDGIK